MNYFDIINNKSFKDNLTYLNTKIKNALQQQNQPLKLIGNIFYGHKPGDFFNYPLLPEQEKKRERFVRALADKTNMFEIGIIDPAKVTRSTLQNAASIASMVLTTECIIVDKATE